jgi:hypothetical protein
MRRLIAIVNDEDAPYGAQIAATNAVLDRAFGKPKHEIQASDQGATLEQMLLAIWEEKHAGDAEQAQEQAEGERPATNSE